LAGAPNRYPTWLGGRVDEEKREKNGWKGPDGKEIGGPGKKSTTKAKVTQGPPQGPRAGKKSLAWEGNLEGTVPATGLTGKVQV